MFEFKTPKFTMNGIIIDTSNKHDTRVREFIISKGGSYEICDDGDIKLELPRVFNSKDAKEFNAIMNPEPTPEPPKPKSAPAIEQVSVNDEQQEVTLQDTTITVQPEAPKRKGSKIRYIV